MHSFITFQEYLESYLKQEGLYSIILESRKASIFTFPIVSAWILILFLSQCSFILFYTNFESWIIAISAPILTLSLVLGVFLIYFLYEYVRFLRYVDSKAPKDMGKIVNLTFIGGFMILGSPVFTALSLPISYIL